MMVMAKIFLIQSLLNPKTVKNLSLKFFFLDNQQAQVPNPQYKFKWQVPFLFFLIGW